jgi:hypothetical protein
MAMEGQIMLSIIRMWLSMPIGISTTLPEPDVTIGFRALQKIRQLIHLDDLSILQPVERDHLYPQGRSVVFRTIENVNLRDVVAINNYPLKGHFGGREGAFYRSRVIDETRVIQAFAIRNLNIVATEELAQRAGISSGREHVIEYALQEVPRLFTRKISHLLLHLIGRAGFSMPRLSSQQPAHNVTLEFHRWRGYAIHANRYGKSAK